MSHIADIIVKAFQGLPEDEQGDLDLMHMGPHSPVKHHLIGREILKLTDNEMVFDGTEPNVFRFDTKRVVSQILSDKSVFKQHVHVPKTISFPCQFSVQTMVGAVEKEFDYPVFVKPDRGSNGKNAISVYNSKVLKDALDTVCRDDKDGYVVIQEKIEIDREYRCVLFDGHAYMLFDRMMQERGLHNGRSVTGICNNDIKAQHITCPEIKERLTEAGRVALEALGVRYGAVDFAKDKAGDFWFVETNSAPQITATYDGVDTQKAMLEMARDIIDYVRE